MNKSMEKFIEKNKISMQFEREAGNPWMNTGGHKMRHYRITLSCQGEEMHTYFSMGMGLAPSPGIGDVLGSLASESATYENCGDISEFMSEFGYEYTDDGDIPKSVRQSWKGMDRNARALQRILGPEAYAELLWEVECG